MTDNVRLTLHPERPGANGAEGAPHGALPSQEIVERAHRIIRVSDARGRTLGIKLPSLLDRLHTYEIVGAQNAQNDVYLGLVGTVLSVVELDGERLPFPATKRELEARVTLVGEEGAAAAGRVLSEHLGEPSAAEAKEAAKNVSGTPA